MLPASYTAPTAAILAIGGLLACFAGYRLFRLVLGIYGFVLGAMVTTSFMGTSNLWALVLAAAVGGLVGAVLMIAAYFMGVGLVGAGLAALLLHLIWRFVGGEPPTVLLVVVCVVGALGALSIARYVVIFGTALAGAWTLIVGVLAFMGDHAAVNAASAGNVWILYPFDPLLGRWWYTVLWFVLALAGVIVQLATSSRKGKGKRARKA
jgi:Domain of unknown function (DUF4203)